MNAKLIKTQKCKGTDRNYRKIEIGADELKEKGVALNILGSDFWLRVTMDSDEAETVIRLLQRRGRPESVEEIFREAWAAEPIAPTNG